ncbi:MAG TPA: PDZ domain-containing protein, partial [Candidatus Limnocylindrales bacterium]|nr:PDZ domain-containing protein [Candidatus Limnocylindrales bacterium]
PINPGNSGGALVDLAGQVVGIPTLAATDPQLGGSAPGIGFAVPSNIATDIARQLIQSGKVTSSHRAYLGVQIASVTNANGVLVFSVESGGPAAKAGIPENVLITAIAGKPTPDPSALAAVLAGLEPGQTVDVEITKRDGSTSTVKVTLGELPG